MVGEFQDVYIVQYAQHRHLLSAMQCAEFAMALWGVRHGRGERVHDLSVVRISRCLRAPGTRSPPGRVF